MRAQSKVALDSDNSDKFDMQLLDRVSLPPTDANSPVSQDAITAQTGEDADVATAADALEQVALSKDRAGDLSSSASSRESPFNSFCSRKVSLQEIVCLQVLRRSAISSSGGQSTRIAFLTSVCRSSRIFRARSRLLHCGSMT